MALSPRKAVTAVAALAASALIGGMGIVTPAAAHTDRARLAPVSALRESPGPDCADNGNVNPCWEYQTWFWTFDACNSYAAGHPFDPSRYDRHLCAVFTGGATVGLWFHKDVG